MTGLALIATSTFGSVHGLLHSTAFDVARNLVLFLAVVFWLGLAYWVYRDARRRVDDPWLVATAALLAVVVPFFGAVIYLLFRAPETLDDVRARELEVRALEERTGSLTPHCPVCRADVEASFLVCPVCTTQLKESCVRCSAPLEPLWQACPYCATPVGAAATHKSKNSRNSTDPAAADLDAALTAEAIAVPRKPQQRKKPRQSRAAAS